MQFTEYNSDYYPMLESWWAAKSFGPVPEMILPREGWIVGVPSKPIAAAFLYKATSAPIAWMEWLVASPDATKEERDEAIPALLTHIEYYAADNGINVLFTSTRPEGVVRRLESCGYIVTDTGMTNLVKGVQCVKETK